MILITNVSTIVPSVSQLNYVIRKWINFVI